MNCTICQHDRQAEMIIDYAYSCSLRVTASRFKVGYRSLQRHIERCVYAILEEAEQRDYEEQLSDVAVELGFYFGYKMRPRPRRSIVSKNVEFSWSRRGWKEGKN